MIIVESYLLQETSNILVMKQSFFEYFKHILQSVSFDKTIFNAEYRKAFQYLSKDEMSILQKWLVKKGYLDRDQATNKAA